MRVKAVVLAAALLASFSLSAFAADFKVFKSPYCGCCGKWVEHLEANGHSVTVENHVDMDKIKKLAGVPEEAESCHTALVDGYVIEGHVPAKDIERFLAERPKVRGLAVPGMPQGSPGMETGRRERYNTVTFDENGIKDVYARH